MITPREAAIIQEQTTSQRTPQQDRARRDGWVEAVILLLGFLAVGAVVAWADTPVAAAYRATLARLVGG